VHSLERKALEIHPEMGVRLVAESFESCGRLLPGEIAFRHPCESEWAKNVDVLEHLRPDILRLQQPVRVGSKHHGLFWREASGSTLEIGEEVNDLGAITNLCLLSLVGMRFP